MKHEILSSLFELFFIPHHKIVVGHYDDTLVRVSVHLSAHPSVCIFQSIRPSFPDDNLSRYQWIFTKLGFCFAKSIESKFHTKHRSDIEIQTC